MAENMLTGIPFQFEPKRPNRFVAEFIGLDDNNEGAGIEVYTIQKFKRPKLVIASKEINYMNTKNFVAGIYYWDSMTIELLDLIGPSTSMKVMEWVRLCAESISGRMGYAAGYKKNIILKQLDPTGMPIDKWTLEQCMITDVDFGDNDHTSDDLQKITITIQPFMCVHNI